MLQSTLFLPCLLLLVPHTFQVQSQLQRSSRKLYFDQKIVKPSASRNLYGFNDAQGVTDGDWVGHQNQNGLGVRRRQGQRGREQMTAEPQGRGASRRWECLHLNQLFRRSRADRVRSRRLGTSNIALQQNNPRNFHQSHPPAGFHCL